MKEVEKVFITSEKNENIWTKDGKIECILMEHMYNMGILKTNDKIKKKNAILDPLMGILIRENISESELTSFIKDVNDDLVINLNIFKSGGNLDDFVLSKWTKIIKSLWRYRSVGLGTPNAASGEGEFMFIFSSKNIKKPSKGDLLIKDDIIELKGEETRVMGKISGKRFREKTLEICKKYNLTPNESESKNETGSKIDAVEIEKKQHETYWKNELKKLSLDDQKKFINEWLFVINNKYNYKTVENIFINDFWNQEIMIKEIVKILYSSMIENGDFKKFVILGDSTDIKILSNIESEFNEAIDSNKIEIKKNFFRINQDKNIGWYIF